MREGRRGRGERERGLLECEAEVCMYWGRGE